MIIPTFVVLWNEEASSPLQLQPEGVFCMLCIWGYVAVINCFFKEEDRRTFCFQEDGCDKQDNGSTKVSMF